jgi:hypothetical protein
MAGPVPREALFVVCTPTLDMREVPWRTDKLHELMGGDLTVVGALAEHGIVALARRDPPPGALLTDISFCTGRDVDRVPGDVLLYRTDGGGRLVPLTARHVRSVRREMPRSGPAV